VTGPRQPAGPRAGAGRRAAGGARTAGAARPATRAAVPARAVLEPSAAATAEPAPPLAGSDGLSGWQLLLAELNAMLRDPTLTRALTALARNIAGGVRALAAATADAGRELARALVRLLGLPWLRRTLLALLVLALPLALLSLLGSSRDDRGRAARQPAQAASGGLVGPSLGGVAMPDLRAAPDRVRPVRVALVLDRTYGPATLRREMRALGTWLAENHAPGTRVSVIDARSARASGRLRAADLTAALPARPRPSTTAAIRSAFGRQKARRLLVTVGSATVPAGTASTLRVATRRGAGAGAITRLPGAKRSRVTIDDRRPNALAASIARAIMSISGERERR
jgi:hypothetical protein